MTRILAIGDVIGRAGRNILATHLPHARKKYDPDIVILNGENAAGGFGLTEGVYQEFTESFGVDCITTGNHWHDKAEIFSFHPRVQRLVLPANMFNVANEHDGLRIMTARNGQRFAVMNLIGKAFMHDGNRNPFEAGSRLLTQIPADVKIRIVDMHAEATSEKQGMGFFMSGKVSLVYGTHSHVPTCDERILNDFTGFITDIGATGGYDSIIGMGKEAALKRLLTGARKEKLEPAMGDPWLCAIVVDIDDTSGRCHKIERFQWRANHMDLS